MNAPTVGLSTKLFYGFGAVAHGVKDSGFSYFLLIYYSQVLGVPPALAGLAIFVALLADAVTDPLVGHWSDNLHSRWGRRHPFLYASALPVALAFFLLWNPPAGLQGAELFPYLLGVAILLRFAITLFEIPSSALVAELTDDYDERTTFFSYRYFFGWWGGLSMSVTALAFLLTPSSPGAADGYFNVEGYRQLGQIGAVLIFVAILVSAIGTHRHIPTFRQPPARVAFDLRRIVGEAVETLSNRSFFALFFAVLILGLAGGVATTLSQYFYGFFWELTTKQASSILLAVFGSALIALLLAPRISRRIGKRRGAIVVGVLAFLINPLPILLRLCGLFPDNGTQLLFVLLFLHQLIDVALIITTQILMASMLTDVVEEAELRTGRRSEGIFFAAQTFARKSVTGLGVMLAGGILALVGFPGGAERADITPAAVRNLGIVYAPIVLVLYMVGISVLRFYRIDRERHRANLARLAATAVQGRQGPAASTRLLPPT